MFDKVLVANRGEIACRVIRTCRRLGIGTVAVYSDADRHAAHVEMAHEAFRIGPPPAADSYLRIDAILDACAATNASAVHPGYGFLSERAAFPRALTDAGVVFIGPNAAAIDAMGDKIESKRRAREAGVSTVPGGDGEVANAADAASIAAAIGYPVMIKASAGGGGKGMRIANSAAEVQEGFDRARSEAASSFGDSRVFVEKFIVDPRHIEMQVLGDQHGNVIHLLERECSIQRRNQKIIEEAPSPLLTDSTRAAMEAQAVALAKAVGYDSAGTVEFVADQSANFYFLEMNTRLQVEHPVTEMITGLDLVEEMIRAAAGLPLRHAQGDIRADGWAIEARLYAEDPERGFLPSIGRLRRLRMPAEQRAGAGESDGAAQEGVPQGGATQGGATQGGATQGGAVHVGAAQRDAAEDGSTQGAAADHQPTPPGTWRAPDAVRAPSLGVRVRVDSGVVEGSEITRFYDPMIAKIITHGPSRDKAIDAMRTALGGVSIEGIRHNALFLSAVMAHPRWSEGRLSTAFIAEEYPDGVFAPITDEIRTLMAAVACAEDVAEATRRRGFGDPAAPEPNVLAAIFADGTRIDADVTTSGAPWRTPVAMRGDQSNAFKADVRIGGVGYLVTWSSDCWSVSRHVVLQRETHLEASLSASPTVPPEFEPAVVVGRSRCASGLVLTHNGVRAVVRVFRPRIADLVPLMPKVSTADGGKRVLCPMPGLVVSIAVRAGDRIEDGQTLAVIEAMKMENVIRAERAGTVKMVHAVAGASLAVDAVIMEFD